MRALTLTRFGGPEVMQVREGAEPEPGPGEVRIRVERAGINFADIMARLGLYPDLKKTPAVLGYEAAGYVERVGPDVKGLREGDRVVAGMQRGAQAESAVVSAALTLPLPSQLSFDEAAAMPVNYLTAAWMLHEQRRVRPGERVLIHMAAGGVGHAVIQLCRAVGEIELFGTASASKHEALRREGLTHPIDYRNQDYVEEVRSRTGGRGLSLIMDPLGGKEWKRGYGLLEPGGLLIAYGWSRLASGPRRNYLNLARELMNLPVFTPMRLMNENRGIAGLHVGHLFDETERLAALMRRILGWYEEGFVRPRVDKVFPLSEGGDAHRYIQERKNVGKVLLDCTR